MKATKKAQQVNESAGFEKIQINDDGQVVDERQLLKAGLNVVKNESNREKYVKSYQLQHRVPFESRTRTQIQARRQLQTEKIMQQIEDDEQNRAIEDQKQRDNITQQYKSRKTESSISSARERYLARKQAARLGEDLNRKSTS